MKTNCFYNKKIWCVIFSVFIIMTILSFLTPIGGDDFIYSFNDSSTVRPLNLYDIFVNMSMQREFVTARVVSHFFVELFLMLPKYIFNILNGLIAAYTAFILYKYISAGDIYKKDYLKLLILAISMIWCLSPVFGQIFLWLDGSCNYGWAIALILTYIYPYYLYYISGKKIKSTPFKILYAVFALIAGAYSENGSLAAIGISLCVLVLLLVGKKRIPLYLFINLILAICGYIFLMTAPVITTGYKGELTYSLSTIALLAFAGIIIFGCLVFLAVKKPDLFRFGPLAALLIWILSIVLFYNDSLKMIISSTYFLLPTIVCIFLAVFSWSIYSRISSNILLFSLILLLAGIGSVLVFAFAIYFPARSSIYLVVFFIVAIVLMLKELPVKIFKVFFYIFIILFIICFIWGFSDILSVHQQYLERMEIIDYAHSSGESTVHLKQYTFNSKYTSQYGIDDIGDNPENYWINRYLANYYNLGLVFGISPDT